MSPEWLSAAAAVVQAIGSVAAIYAAVRIATRAEGRARKAEEAADLRARAAEERAQRTILTQMLNRRQKIFEQVRERLQPTLAALDKAIASAEGHIQDGSTVMGGFSSPDKESIEKLIAALTNATDDVELVSILEDVRRATDAWTTPSSMSWSEYLGRLQTFRSNLETGLAHLETYATETSA
jgi:hypothetical protein